MITPKSTPTTTTSSKKQMGKISLYLYNGRDTLEEELEDWGYHGPTLTGEYFQFTYTTLWLYTEDENLGIELPIVGGCILWQGKYYGDFSISAE